MLSFLSRIPKRYILVLLGFIGFIYNYALRVNMNLIITSMAGKEGEDADFNWSTNFQNDVVGSFFYGYMVLQIPGGRVAEIFGGKRVLALAMGGTALLTLVIPTAADLGTKDSYPYALVAIRVVMGLFEGCTFPAVSSMMARWAPLSERSLMSTLIMAGSQVGTIVGFYLSGVLVDTLGWRNTFYIQGATCFIWLVFWLILVFDSPEVHPRISPEEKAYIVDGRPNADANKTPPIPWRAMVTSIPVWAVILANFGNNWGFHLLMTELPQYLKNVFPDDMDSSSKTGMWTAIPYACMWVFSLTWSFTADYVIKSKILPIGIVRKISNTVAHTGAGICLLALLLVATDTTDQTEKERELRITLGLFTTAVTVTGALYSAWIVNPQDVCPNFAGTLLGISNCIGSIPGFVSPKVAGILITGHESEPSYWRPVWIITVAVLVTESLAYILMASGNVQKWNDVQHKEEEMKKTKTPIV